MASTDLVLITDPSALAAIEPPRNLVARLGGPAAYASITRVLDQDLREFARADPKAGVGVAGNDHRLFDRRWLDLTAAPGRPATSFDLIGISNRLDRVPFTSPSCGDVRLVYRLAYRATISNTAVASRLPMTISLVYPQPPPCDAAARRWRVAAGLTGAALAAQLSSPTGPLAPALLGPAQLTEVQTNLQSMRWPAAVRPDLGGHAEYTLRSFVPAPAPAPPGTFQPGPLANTPDVARLRKQPALLAELTTWLRDPATLARIDAGTAVLPAHLAATRASSLSPRGLARRANRPFLQLLPAPALAKLQPALDLGGRSTIATPAALLRRLDDFTCMGCHQSRGLAGFHLLGVDAPGQPDALAVAASPHLLADLARRRAIVASFADGGSPELSRPPSDRAARGDSGPGAHCGLGDPGFASWTCDPGLTCVAHDAPADDASVGVCVAATAQVGDACEHGAIRPNPDPRRDRLPGARQSACAEGSVCNTSPVGFPGGMCTADCGSLPAGATCGAIAILRDFNACLARRTPFPRCLADNVTPAGLRACDDATPCRDDYICARTPSGAGACIPPYFLFQLRVDGHP